jgi:hypothetical protein
MRAPESGISLSAADAAIVKGMILRGDRQHDIAAWFGVNGGRIGDISTSKTFAEVPVASGDKLPPPGPYIIGRHAQEAVTALEAAAGDAKAMLELAEEHPGLAIQALKMLSEALDSALGSIGKATARPAD